MATPQTGTNDLSSDSTYDQISKGLEVLGSILIGGGMPSVVRIPIPGTGGLAVELIALGFVPKAGSTSTLFFQTLDGKRNLRLDYGFNKKTNTVDFHWNQKGTCDVFGITDHSLSGKWGEGLYKGARAFRYTGRVLVVLGAVVDVASIVTAHDKWRQASSVAGGCCRSLGGAALGSVVPGLGTAVGAAVGAFIGGIGGGIGGYCLGSSMATYVYDKAPDAIEKVGSSIEELDAEIMRTYLAAAQA